MKRTVLLLGLLTGLAACGDGQLLFDETESGVPVVGEVVGGGDYDDGSGGYTAPG